MNPLKLWRKSLGIEISTEMSYKTNFIIKSFALLFSDTIGPLVILLIYTNTAGIPGWSFEQFILFQGTLILTLGINHLCFMMFPNYVVGAVRRGTFDKYLIKPFNPLIYLTFSSWDLEGVAEVLTGIALVIFAIWKLQLFSTTIIFYIILIIVAVLFLYAAMVMIGAMAFLVVKSWALFDVFFKMSDFGRYPISVYSGSLRFILTFIFPVAIAAFYPATLLIKGLSFLTMIEITLPVIGFLIVSLFFWNLAMKKYTSAGG